jgi:hypothetical protein
MTWKTIRLELARTKEFPEGSASRAYLLRLPMDDDGLIDETELRDLPAQATVRRFWPNEPDLSGYLIRTSRGWAFSYRLGEEDDATIFHLETHPLLTEPDGRKLPFRVASIREFYRAA